MDTTLFFRHYWMMLRDAICLIYFKNKHHHGKLNALFAGAVSVPAVFLIVTTLIIHRYSKYLLNRLTDYEVTASSG